MGNIFNIDLVYPQQIATSSVLSPTAYVIYTGVVAVIFLVFQIIHFIDFIPEFGAFYFIFLTNWALILETVTMILLHVSNAMALMGLGGGSQEPPLMVRIVVAMWYIIQPISLIVVILYWTLINPIFDFTPVRVSSYWAHLGNWLVLLTSLFFSTIPWAFKNAIWGLLFLAAYLIWTLIHFFARIGTKEPCDNYPQPECPIYDEFDWNLPGPTFGVVVLAFVAYLLVAGLYHGLFRLRDSCASTTPAAAEAEKKDVENGA